MPNEIRTILVDHKPERRDALSAARAAEGFHLVAVIAPDDDLMRAVVRYAPDVVLIDIDSPSRDTLESLRSAQAHQPRPMVMFTQDDAEASIRRAVEAGVSAYVVDGIANRRVRPVVESAMALFSQYRSLEQELADARGKLEDRKLIERAKGIVMEQQGISEAEAYQAMRRLAMRKNKRLVDVAESVIAAAELLQG